MADSIKLVNDTKQRGGKPSGRLHKGHNVAAASASIPSKYQTVVTDNADKKGFSSQSKRFSYESESNVNPGPGTYVGSSNLETKQSHESFSKKGTGGFASKDRRILKHQLGAGPGPAAYGFPELLDTRRDHNKASSTSSFHQPIATNKLEGKGSSPAPNQYNVMQIQQGKVNNVTADAAFKSKSTREVINFGDAASKPAPWQYHVNDDLTKDSVKIPLSSFKSKTVRGKLIVSTNVPGPGTYHPFEASDPVQRMIFPRKHYLCISAPAMPLPKTPPAPGPGSYEIVNFDGPTRHYMSGAAFVSTTSRWAGDNTRYITGIPGPAHYRPGEVGKQSFIYNATGRWI